MDSTSYEQHIFSEQDLPIFFHNDKLKFGNNFFVHWHENIEILYFRQGSADVYCDTVPYSLAEGEIIVINSGALHSIYSKAPECCYDCLIVDKNLLQDAGFPLDEVHLTNIVKDSICGKYFDEISQELEAKEAYYKIAVKSSILRLFTRLYRISEKSSVPAAQSPGKKLEMVRRAVSYIRQHYREEITIDDICRHVGFSKYYFCHEFKKITGKTVIDTINFLRCSHARSLLETGLYNVAESAENSGFSNISYFTRTYKKYMGILPSETIKYTCSTTNHQK
ncbi:MAG TPA: AraC family transcriptional regulator [Clostridiales bacterium]|nr:AraC family transcriptional regulator [Clostridiales bacterium]